MQRISGILLAGGQSRRMGRDKAWLPVPCHSTNSPPILLEFMLERLYTAGIERVAVSCNRSDLPQSIPGNILISDRGISNGPLTGIATCLDALPDGRVVIIPVDMPGLSISAIHQLMHHTGVVCYRDHALPCGIVNCTETRSLVSQRALQNGRSASVRALLDDLHVEHLRCSSRDGLINTNTPEEWQQFWEQERGYDKACC